MPFTVANAAILGLPVPYRFQHMAFPDPHGNCTTAKFDKAMLASGLLPKPLNISYGSPSPEQAAITS